MKLKIKVGDEVKVIAGSDKGRKGKVLEFKPSTMKIRVKDIFMQTCFNKQDSKIEKKEGFIDYSNVVLLQAASQAERKQASKKTGKKSSGFFGKK